MFDRFFPLNGSANIIVRLVVNEHFKCVSLGEAVNQTLAMLIGSARQVARDADIKRAITPVRHHIDPATLACELIKMSMAETSPFVSTTVMAGLVPAI